jgi:hypothetical protein
MRQGRRQRVTPWADRTSGHGRILAPWPGLAGRTRRTGWRIGAEAPWLNLQRRPSDECHLIVLCDIPLTTYLRYAGVCHIPSCFS